MSGDYRDYSDINSDEYCDGFGYTSRRRTSQRSGGYDLSTFDDSHSDEVQIYPEHRAKKRRRRKRKRAFKRFVSLLLVVLIVVSVLFGIYVYKILDSVNYAELDGVYKEHYASQTELLSHKDVFNILIFGVDDVADDYGRSDTMLLLSVDNKNSKLKLTSFQRDTFVYVPDPDGDYHTKLTNAYSYGGVGLAIHTIEANFGVQIDRYVTVNFETFKSIVDVLGGVQLELTDREILYINCQLAQNNQSGYLDAQAGTVTLNGQQALWHIRNRGGDVINGVEFFEDTDWDRTQRQRLFVEAVMCEVRKGSLFSALRVSRSVAPYVTTNLSKAEIVSLLLQFPRLMNYKVEQCSMPSEGNWGYEENFAGSVIYVYDWETTQQNLGDFIYEFDKD